MKRWAIIIALLVIVTGCAGPAESTVAMVYDGDSFVMANGDEIRLIGIDAPEKGQPGAAQARAFLKQLIEGRQIRLQADKQDKDRYGRLLRYAYLPAGQGQAGLGETFINAEMLRRGHAQTFFIPPNGATYKEQLLEAENQSRQSKTGIWAPDLPVYITQSGEKYHRAGCESLLKSRILIKIKDARDKGFGPCKKCNPPE